MSYKHFSFVLLGIALGAFTMGALQFTFAWTAPAGAPPTANVAAPINVSATAQNKVGNFTTSNSIGAGVLISAPWVCVSGDCRNKWPIDTAGNYTGPTNINMVGKQVTGLGAPVNGTDAATKAYVDSKFGSGKADCSTATIVSYMSMIGLPTSPFTPPIPHGKVKSISYSAGSPASPDPVTAVIQCWNNTILTII